MKEVDWRKQHNGIHQGKYEDVIKYMPDLKELLNSFPENVNDFIWDVKVHMLMPNQYPCIPNWHYDNVPRVNNKQDFDLIKPDLPMYLWVSETPLTEFRKEGKSWFIKPKTWTRMTQKDEHRGTMSTDFQWRGFIRATHKEIYTQNNRNHDVLRRHSQVYLDVNNFTW
jgi:hypothetical protein